MVTIEEYLEDLNKNLLILSRTANGFVDLSSSKTKEEVMLIKDENKAKDKAIDNFNHAIKYAYVHKDDEFTSPKKVKEFIEDVALYVTDGFIKSEDLYRHGDECLKYKYVKIKDIQKTMNLYCEKLYNCFKKSNYNPIYAAALSEFYIDFRGHFFMDGCCKTSLVISAYCLMRKDVKVASYINRDLYYKYAPNSYNDSVEINRFYKYFKMIHEAKDLWVDYCENNMVKSNNYDLYFLNDEEIEAIYSGYKTAFSYLLDYKDKLPKENDYHIVINKKNKPLAIVRTTSVRHLTYKEFSYDEAKLEGLGDFTLAYWKYSKEPIFKQECEQHNTTLNINTKLLFEEFNLACKVLFK